MHFLNIFLQINQLSSPSPIYPYFANKTLSLTRLNITSASAYESSFNMYQNIKWIDNNEIIVTKYIDEGRFSHVLAGQWNHTLVVIKVLKETFAGKIKRELRMLYLCRDIPQVVALLGVVKCASQKTIALVFESLEEKKEEEDEEEDIETDHCRKRNEFSANVNPSFDPPERLSHHLASGPLTSKEVKNYMRALLSGLAAMHARNVMHRDIKNRNLVIHRRSSSLRIIDLGLSEIYQPGKQYNLFVCSKFYKAPELLLKYVYYDFAVDIWSAGCVFASLLFIKEPFFRGNSKYDQISFLASLFGADSILKYATKYSLHLNTNIRKILRDCVSVSWNDFLTQENRHLVDEKALDLLKRMLAIDHSDRPTAAECLQHPYFEGLTTIYPAVEDAEA